ncbi:MAG: MFS transporter [Sedimentisphaerales bacterium]
MRQLFKDKNFLRLCLATFFLSSCLQLIWIVLPFIVKAMNGSDTDVGVCFMAQMGTYVVFCILLGTIIDRFKPKRVLVLGAAAQILVVIGLLAVVRFASLPGISLGPIMQIAFLMAVIGIITAFFWPMMMGWVSTGHEGAELTKRFGFYNTTWSSANMILPIIGGYLMEIDYQLPLVLAGLMSIGCFAAASAVRCPSENPEPKEITPDIISGEEYRQEKKQFLWMSRVALFAIYLCVGLFRSQLGILYKFDLHFPESAFGWSVSFMCLVTVVVFWLMGKSHYWHYKKGLFFFSQFSVIGCMLVVIFSDNFLMQFFAAGLSGICYGVVYSSHQYYGVSGGTKRSGLMAVHETLIGAGFASGSIFGGILSDAFGRRSPYWFGCAVIIAAGLIQILLWVSLKMRESEPRT